MSEEHENDGSEPDSRKRTLSVDVTGPDYSKSDGLGGSSSSSSSSSIDNSSSSSSSSNSNSVFEVGISHNKRTRLDNDDGIRQYTTRLLVNKQDFSRIIGKQGIKIKEIQQACGVNMKGDNVDEDQRLISISGEPRRVLVAFEKVADIIFATNTYDYSQLFRLTFLIENAKVGRLIGSKGSTLNLIKAKAGCPNLTLIKEPIDVCGGSYRFIVVESQQSVIRSVHSCILEAMCDQSSLVPSGSNSNFASASAATSYPATPVAVPPPFLGISAAPGQLVPIPMEKLVSECEIQPETARQLIEMKEYLRVHFKLNLTISRDNPNMATATGGGSGVNFLVGGSQQTPSQKGEVSFLAPHNVCGGIIGNKGGNLRELMDEFPVKVFVEKDDIDGKRKVRIIPNGPDPESIPSSMAVQKCKAKIFELVKLQYNEEL